MSAAQYVGRVFDLMALRGADYPGEVELSQTLFDSASSGEVCTGIQKLAQRWVMEFLTAAGSMTFMQERGCSFIPAVNRGSLRLEADIEAEFGFAAADVQKNLNTDDTDDTPDDERLAEAHLMQIVLQDAGFSLRVWIESVAGGQTEVILPVNFVPSNLAL